MVCVLWVVAATKTVLPMRSVTTANAKIHAKQLEFAVRMLYANLTTMSPLVSVPLDSKVIQHLNKAVYDSHLPVWRQINALLAICVLPINAMYHVPTIYLVQSANVALTTSVPRSATQTTIAYLVRFATIREHANRDVQPTVTVPLHKFVSMANVNAELDLLERRLVALTLMNVRKNHVIQAHVVKMRLARSDVFVPIKPSEIRTAILDVYNRINVVVTLIVLIIWLVCKENVQILVLLPNVEETLNVNPSITKLCVIVHLAI